MVKCGPRVAPAAMFVLSDNEAYAGTLRAEWKAIIFHMDFLEPVESKADEECGICHDSFCSAEDEEFVPEQPVSLPCRHIFGGDCIWQWMTQDIRGAVESLRAASAVGPNNFDNLMPRKGSFRTIDFTCPLCRHGYSAPIMDEQTKQNQATMVEARLRFWDRAYEKLGIIRSEKEEAYRQDLRRFVDQIDSEVLSEDQIRSYDLRARVSAMRFALRRAKSHLTPVQSHLRDALFNLACIGFDDAPEEYQAEWYEDQELPIWCWQFDRIERGIDPSYESIGGALFDYQFIRQLEQQRLGPWRRTLMAELEESRLVYQSKEWHDFEEALYDTAFAYTRQEIDMGP